LSSIIRGAIRASLHGGRQDSRGETVMMPMHISSPVPSPHTT
jgi:hypothetical protein